MESYTHLNAKDFIKKHVTLRIHRDINTYSAVLPESSQICGSAPLDKSNSTTFAWLAPAARCNAVRFWAPRTFGSSPSAIKSSQEFLSPEKSKTYVGMFQITTNLFLTQSNHESNTFNHWMTEHFAIGISKLFTCKVFRLFKKIFDKKCNN